MDNCRCYFGPDWVHKYSIFPYAGKGSIKCLIDRVQSKLYGGDYKFIYYNNRIAQINQEGIEVCTYDIYGNNAGYNIKNRADCTSVDFRFDENNITTFEASYCERYYYEGTYAEKIEERTYTDIIWDSGHIIDVRVYETSNYCIWDSPKMKKLLEDYQFYNIQHAVIYPKTQFSDGIELSLHNYITEEYHKNRIGISPCKAIEVISRENQEGFDIFHWIENRERRNTMVSNGWINNKLYCDKP